jgi:hypothetical protein
MQEYLRMLKNPVGMGRLMVNYSRIKELEANGLSIETIADAFVKGETVLALDIGTHKKEAFEEVAKALS